MLKIPEIQAPLAKKTAKIIFVQKIGIGHDFVQKTMQYFVYDARYIVYAPTVNMKLPHPAR